MKDSNDSFDWISELLDEAGEQELAERTAGDKRAAREARIIGAVRSSIRQRRDSLRTQVPVALVRSIRMAVAQEADAAREPRLVDRLRTTYASLFARPAYSFAALAGVVAIVASVVLYTRSEGILPSNLSDAALTAYADVSDGDGSVDLRSSDTTDLRAFFANHGVAFEVFFPTFAAALVGGTVRSIHGREFPVLVYRNAGHFISLLEVDQGAIDDHTVDMDRTASEDVEKSKWHWASSDDRTLFVWKSNSIMCSVVTDLAVNEVSALFSLEVL